MELVKVLPHCNLAVVTQAQQFAAAQMPGHLKRTDTNQYQRQQAHQTQFHHVERLFGEVKIGNVGGISVHRYNNQEDKGDHDFLISMGEFFQ
jgi:hypothetical protein